MPSARYYREQAKVLQSLAMVTSDPDYAAQLKARRRIYLTKAEMLQGAAVDFSGIVDGFEDLQMRKT
jgi:hypothetical protein